MLNLYYQRLKLKEIKRFQNKNTELCVSVTISSSWDPVYHEVLRTDEADRK